MAIIISLLLSIAFFFSITIIGFILEQTYINPLLLTALVIILNAYIIYLVIR